MRRPVNKKGGAATPPQFSLLKDEMAAAILLPASFVAFCAEGFFLAVADGLDPAGADAGSGERSFYRACTLVPERQIVVGGSTFVAVSFNGEVEVGVLVEKLHIRLQRS